MKIKITFLLGLSSVLGFGQEIKDELPVLSPQSPTTADLGKYGNVQVNESTGIISPSIPLFEYNAGKTKIPIALNYSGNGVRVNQDPTWAGVNWNINPGGVITRIVRDKTDELTDITNRKYFSEQGLDSLSGVRAVESNLVDLVPSTPWYGVMNHLTFENTDSEADLFNYNFLGYSGSFFLDQNNNVHLIKYDKEVSIIFVLAINYDSNNDPISQSQIIITTPEGNKYYFGGVNASESTRTIVQNGAGSTANIPFSQNAFYLDHISFLNGGSVFFVYDNLDTFCDSYKIGIQESASVSTPLGNFPCNKNIKTLKNEIQNLVKLRKITNTFTNEVVEFETSFTGICDRMTRLNSVSLKNGTTLSKKVELVYQTINNEPTNTPENKFFLSKVEFYNKNSNFEYDYELTYQTPELFPSKESFAQDHLGYYNGKNSNTTLLPKTTTSILNLNCHFGLADREADVAASKIGALTAIKYPTGGRTEFEYELPYKGEEDVYQSHYRAAYYRDSNRNYSSSPYTCTSNINKYSDGFFFPNSSPLQTQTTQTINASVTIQINGFYSHPIQGKIIARNSNNIQTVSAPITLNSGAYDNETFTENLSIANLAAGSYTFQFVLELHNADSHNCSTQVENNLNSVSGVAHFYLPNGTRSVYYPGLRIKRTLDYADDFSPNITRYYYNRLDNYSQESFVFQPKYVQKTWRLNTENVAGTFVEKYNLSTNSVSNVFNNDMGSYTYEYVTTSYGGDNFQKGGKESKFKKTNNLVPTLYKTHPNMFDGYYVYGWSTSGGPSDGGDPMISFGDNLNVDVATAVDVTTNQSYENSMLIQERFFNSNQNILKVNKFNYQGTEDYIGHNIKVANLAEISVLAARNITYYCYLLYKTKTFKYRLLSKETTDYLGSTYTNEIKSTTTYQYNNDKVSLPSVIETSNSFEEIERTNLYYPSDVATLTSLQYGDVSYLNTLTQRHNVAELVRTESLLNGNLIGTKQISFGNFGLAVYPKIIKTSKGAGENILEERLEFFDYAYGMPSMVALQGGVKTKYEYNSNMQVVLKIENYTSAYGGTFDPTSTDTCQYQNAYPNSLVTKYDYDPVRNHLVKITDPKCNVTTFRYDEFGRLEEIRDHQGNILSENEYHYKP